MFSYSVISIIIFIPIEQLFFINKKDLRLQSYHNYSIIRWYNHCRLAKSQPTRLTAAVEAPIGSSPASEGAKGSEGKGDSEQETAAYPIGSKAEGKGREKEQ